MEGSSEVPRKRIRTAAMKRWTKEEKQLLLQLIQEEPANFEKPTARIYYNKIIENNNSFAVYGWKAMRDKLRNLRASYTRAIDWQSNTGSGIDTEDAESTVREYILKLCEDFDALDNIFGSRISISPLFIEDSEGTSTENLDVRDSSIPIEIDLIENEDVFTPRTKRKKSNAAINSSVAYLSQVQEEKVAYLRDKLNHEKEINERRLNMEEEHLTLEKEKLEITQQNFREEIRLKEMEIKNNFELNKLKLEKEIALKELELKYKYGK